MKNQYETRKTSGFALIVILLLSIAVKANSTNEDPTFYDSADESSSQYLYETPGFAHFFTGFAFNTLYNPIQSGYRRYANSSIAGFNSRTIRNTTVSRCSRECSRYSWCTSFEYQKRLRFCNLQYGQGRRGTNRAYDLYMRTSPPSGSIATVRGYTRYLNQAIGGYNRTTLRNINASNCAAQCNRYSWCTSFETRKSTRSCNLQYGNGRRYSDRDYTLYIKGRTVDTARNNTPVGRYSRYTGAYIKGFNRSTLRNTTIRNCSISCNRTNWCTSFEYYRPARSCNLQYDSGRISRNSNYTLFKKSDGTAVGDNQTPPGYRMYAGSQITGYHLRQYNNVSVGDCGRYCNGNSRCTSFEYFAPQKFCRLNYGNGRATLFTNYYLYRKVGATGGTGNPNTGNVQCSVTAWAGRWNRTGFGPIIFRRTSSGSVTGTYGSSRHYISGRVVRGRNCTLVGTWRHRNSRRSGRFIFTLGRNGTSFAGTYTSGSVNPANRSINWSGRRN